MHKRLLRIRCRHRGAHTLVAASPKRVARRRNRSPTMQQALQGARLLLLLRAAPSPTDSLSALVGSRQPHAACASQAPPQLARQRVRSAELGHGRHEVASGEMTAPDVHSLPVPPSRRLQFDVLSSADVGGVHARCMCGVTPYTASQRVTPVTSLDTWSQVAEVELVDKSTSPLETLESTRQRLHTPLSLHPQSPRCSRLLRRCAARPRGPCGAAARN